MQHRTTRMTAFLALLMAFALVVAACADSEDTTTTGSTDTTEATTTTEGSATTEPMEEELTPLTLRIGRFPAGAGAGFITQYMLNEDLVEKAGLEFGYDLDVEWLNMANAVATSQALLSGDLDIGPMGSAAYIGLVVEEQPVTPIGVAEGHFKFVIAVRGDSDIRTPEDLVGKRVGTIFGTGLVDAFSAMIEPIFGTADPAEAGIEMVNVSGIAPLATVAEGMDASIVTVPSWLSARQDLGVTAIYNSYGYTEDHYSGPLGEGAGILIPEAENSPFWPDGFVSHRAITVARDGIVDEHPGAVSAYLLATQWAIEDLQGRTPANVAALSSADWQLEPHIAAPIVQDEMLLIRGWPWLTEGEADVMLLQGDILLASDALSGPITWDAMVASMAKGAGVTEAAYEAAGDVPPEEVFLDDSVDRRGYPQWQTDLWTAP